MLIISKLFKSWPYYKNGTSRTRKLGRSGKWSAILKRWSARSQCAAFSIVSAEGTCIWWPSLNAVELVLLCFVPCHAHCQLGGSDCVLPKNCWLLQQLNWMCGFPLVCPWVVCSHARFSCLFGANDSSRIWIAVVFPWAPHDQTHSHSSRAKGKVCAKAEQWDVLSIYRDVPNKTKSGQKERKQCLMWLIWKKFKIQPAGNDSELWCNWALQALLVSKDKAKSRQNHCRPQLQHFCSTQIALWFWDSGHDHHDVLPDSLHVTLFFILPNIS